jgi:hypothetical protein
MVILSLHSLIHVLCCEDITIIIIIIIIIIWDYLSLCGCIWEYLNECMDLDPGTVGVVLKNYCCYI